MTNVMMAM